ncbi:metallo-beta-lactamase superfamily protein, partial [Vibrio parahaemolyticus VPTS-2010_2]
SEVGEDKARRVMLNKGVRSLI